LKKMIDARDRREAGMSAPAHGLILWKVYYKPKRTHAHRAG